eukprot:5296267-Heterocapsa_arctica.AAC.1
MGVGLSSSCFALFPVRRSLGFSGRAGLHVISSDILMTAAAPPFVSSAMEQGHRTGQGSVVESHPEAALWPAL